MKHVCVDVREQIRVESLEDYVEIDSEVIVIEKLNLIPEGTSKGQVLSLLFLNIIQSLKNF